MHTYVEGNRWLDFFSQKFCLPSISYLKINLMLNVIIAIDTGSETPLVIPYITG